MVTLKQDLKQKMSAIMLTNTDKNSNTYNKQSQNGILLSHHILSSIHPKLVKDDILNMLYLDIFNPDDEIALSALELLQKLGNESSYNYLFHIIKEYPQDRKLSALNTLYKIGNSAIVSTLYDLFHVEYDEEIRALILKTLSRYGSRYEKVVKLVLSYADKELHDNPLRLQAIRCLYDIGKWELLKDTVNSSNKEISKTSIETLARFNNIDALFILKRFIPNYDNQPEQFKLTLIKALCIKKYEPILEIIGKSMHNNNEIFVKKVLDIVKEHILFIVMYPQRMLKSVIKLPAYSTYLESELLDLVIFFKNNIKNKYIVDKMSYLLDATLRTYFSKLQVKYKSPISKGSQLEIDIANSKEFIEKFCDPQFLQVIVDCLKDVKGFSSTSDMYNEAIELIDKKSKEIPEAFSTHLESLKNLLSIDDRLQRNRIIFYLREADFNKQAHITKLKRLVNFLSVFKNNRSSDIVYDIYLWAQKMMEKDLVYATLLTAARCRHKMVIKEAEHILNSDDINSKFVNIAIKSIGEYGSTEGLNHIVKYVEDNDIIDIDDDILISITEAISNIANANDYAIEKALLKIFTSATSDIVMSSAATNLAKLSSPKIISILAKYKKSENPKVRELLAMIVGSFAKKFGVEAGILQNFLYSMLKDSSLDVKLSVLVALYRLQDDYAKEILREILSDDDPRVITEAVLHTIEIDDTDRLGLLFDLANHPSETVFLALKHAFSALIESNIQLSPLILNMLKKFRTKDSKIDTGQLLNSISSTKIDVKESIEKKKYIFEKKYTKELSILFVDITGYTSRASKMSLMEIMSYLKSYEEIALPLFKRHQGNIVKKMGDGLMVSFAAPIHAVLSGIRLQEKLRNYNLFKPDKFKIVVRIGINTGPVVIADSDMFGDTVNVASRLETFAEHGKVLVSDATYDNVKDYLQFRQLGPITVKGKAEPMEVFEVLGINAALPYELDPIKKDAKTYEQINYENTSLNACKDLFIVPEGVNNVNIEEVKNIFIDFLQIINKLQHNDDKEQSINTIQSLWDKLCH